MKLFFAFRDLFWLVLVAGSFGCSPKRQPIVDPLPALDEIVAVQAQIDDTASGNQYTLPIEKLQWKAVFDAMRPAKLDTNPAKWQVLGWLDIARKNGNPLTVFLFDVSDGPGAFAVGDKLDNRTYYRGGDSATLRQAILKSKP